MKILYAGAIERGYWIEEYAKKENMDFTHVKSEMKITDHVNSILKYGRQDYTVFDIQHYIDNPEDISDQIKKICAANNSKAVILAPGYDIRSEVIFSLWEQEIRYFIFSVSLTEMKDQFEKCLNGYYDVTDISDMRQIAEEKEQEEKEAANIRMIGIAGACSRIGTTTHAVQIVKYLSCKGYKAAYIQMNSSSYIKNLMEWFNYDQPEADRQTGCIRFENVDHFYKIDKIPEVLKLGYDFYVYDYGTYFDPNFNRVSFLEKDFRIFVVGSGPTELPYTYDIVKSAFYDKVKYIFNFTGPGDQEDIDELMDDKKDDTFLAGYIPDKYVLQDAALYDSVVPVEMAAENSAGTGRKKRFFGKRRAAKV